MEWQKHPGDDSLPPKIRKAIDHIVSCPTCMAEVPEFTAKAADELIDMDFRTRLYDFILTANTHGLEIAAAKHFKVADYLIGNKGALRRNFAFQKSISKGFGEKELPPEVVHAIRSQIKPIDWVYLFAKGSGTTKRGELASQPKLAIEFHLDTKRGTASLNPSPILGLASLAETERICLDRPLEQERRVRESTIHSDTLNAHVSIDPEAATVRILLPPLQEYKENLPEICLLSEDGTATTKEAKLVKDAFEASFTNLKDGTYALAIDVIKGQKTGQRKRTVIEQPQGEKNESTHIMKKRAKNILPSE